MKKIVTALAIVLSLTGGAAYAFDQSHPEQARKQNTLVITQKEQAPVTDSTPIEPEQPQPVPTPDPDLEPGVTPPETPPAEEEPETPTPPTITKVTKAGNRCVYTYRFDGQDMVTSHMPSPGQPCANVGDPVPGL